MNITFAEFSERFMTQYDEAQLAPKTVVRYKQFFKHINPAIGHLKLESEDSESFRKFFPYVRR